MLKTLNIFFKIGDNGDFFLVDRELGTFSD